MIGDSRHRSIDTLYTMYEDIAMAGPRMRNGRMRSTPMSENLLVGHSLADRILLFGQWPLQQLHATLHTTTGRGGWRVRGGQLRRCGCQRKRTTDANGGIHVTVVGRLFTRTHV